LQARSAQVICDSPALHRGTPREAFLKEFLEKHLSERLAVGTGEIIDANSQPRQPRNQFDIVIHKSEFPRIDFGGGVNAFIAESVVATIEVKSLLTEAELATAIQSAARAKQLTRNLLTSFHTGYVPPGIVSYVIAYDGPAQMDTVHRWIKNAEQAQQLNQAQLPAVRAERHATLSQGIEGVFVLGKGFVLHDTGPVSLLDDAIIATNPALRYQIVNGPDGNLLMLFLLLTQTVSNLVAQWPDLIPYVANVRWHFNAAP
jgi:hypothetical protein